mmetsp:Transcript_2114/g.4883  ORF Transcript_2114/g.4883 Transcript_2114/m.4883 type:complete len:97 (-) Transcript_2114:1975-2265(-)
MVRARLGVAPEGTYEGKGIADAGMVRSPTVGYVLCSERSDAGSIHGDFCTWLSLTASRWQNWWQRRVSFQVFKQGNDLTMCLHQQAQSMGREETEA